MNDGPRLISAPDGRGLGVELWGDPAGAPVLGFHGTPGSRLSRPPNEPAVRAAGVRLITYDRPGYGVSDRSSGRAVVDCVADVEAILDELQLDRVAVHGASGGGPHALAVAARLPGRVTAAHCDVGVAPFDAAGLDWMDGLDPQNVTEVGWALQGEQVLHRELTRVAAEDLARMTADPAKVFSDDWQLPEQDRQILARADMQHAFAASMREAFRDGVWGWVDDDLALFRPWGFTVDQVAVPTTVYYGAHDVMVPAAHGAWLADHIPGAKAVVESAGHLPDPDTLVQRLSQLIREDQHP